MYGGCIEKMLLSPPEAEQVGRQVRGEKLLNGNAHFRNKEVKFGEESLKRP